MRSQCWGSGEQQRVEFLDPARETEQAGGSLSRCPACRPCRTARSRAWTLGALRSPGVLACRRPPRALQIVDDDDVGAAPGQHAADGSGDPTAPGRRLKFRYRPALCKSAPGGFVDQLGDYRFPFGDLSPSSAMVTNIGASSAVTRSATRFFAGQPRGLPDWPFFLKPVCSGGVDRRLAEAEFRFSIRADLDCQYRHTVLRNNHDSGSR
jgi:hypothetical protein